MNAPYAPPHADTMDALFVQPRVDTIHSMIDDVLIRYNSRWRKWEHTFVYGDATIKVHIVFEDDSCIITLTGHGSVDIVHYNQRTRLRTRLPIGIPTRVAHVDPQRLDVLQLLDMGQYGRNVIPIVNGGQPILSRIDECYDEQLILIDQTPNPRGPRGARCAR